LGYKNGGAEPHYSTLPCYLDHGRCKGPRLDEFFPSLDRSLASDQLVAQAAGIDGQALHQILFAEIARENSQSSTFLHFGPPGIF
jgi:hypothetical protein